MNKKKKMCCITTIASTTEVFVVEAMKRFVDEGYDVTLACTMSESFKKKYSDKFKCVNITMQRGVSIKDCLKMPFVFYNFFRREKFDYVQYATPNASLYASVGAWLAGVPRRVYCQWGIRYVGSQGIMRKILKVLEHLTCSLSTHIRPASQKNLEFAVKEGLYKKTKAGIIGNGGTIGVDMSKFDISKKDKYREDVLELFPTLKNKIVFVFVGRPNDDKGCRELIEAFTKLSNERDDVRLMMICDEDDETPDYIKSVEGREDIVFTGYTKEVYKYISAADVHVHPSYREGFSMVIQETMAMGLPVVTTDIPGPSEVIDNGVTGLLVEAQNAESLYNGMKTMIVDTAKMKVMGMAGRKRCEEIFNRERMLRLTYEDRISIMNNNK